GEGELATRVGRDGECARGRPARGARRARAGGSRRTAAPAAACAQRQGRGDRGGEGRELGHESPFLGCEVRRPSDRRERWLLCEQTPGAAVPSLVQLAAGLG